MTTGHRGPAGELVDRLLRERADDDRGAVAGERAGGVGDRLAAAELELAAATARSVWRRAARRGRERDACPRRRLLEDAGDRLSRAARRSHCTGPLSSARAASSSSSRERCRGQIGDAREVPKRGWCGRVTPAVVIGLITFRRTTVSGLRVLACADDRLEHLGDRRLADLLELVANVADRVARRDQSRRGRSACR